ncbi:CLUMA_CG019689, isoform A [Clunio marinus]|uniref:CLUMA_CG019689, isoform A n=1 Tax=Clunio marinus TaxID=568069 RepID=A0A1J1J3N6_9DIPT|nr:CLUMA_CG019689, isoform A [Clunio marinus]
MLLLLNVENLYRTLRNIFESAMLEVITIAIFLHLPTRNISHMRCLRVKVEWENKHRTEQAFIQITYTRKLQIRDLNCEVDNKINVIKIRYEKKRQALCNIKGIDMKF